MPTDKPVSLRALLEGNATTLSRLIGKAHGFKALNEQIRQALPPDLAPHLVATSLRDGQLVLMADSAVWAARLRFHAAEVLTHYQRETGPGAHSVKVKVRGPA